MTIHGEEAWNAGFPPDWPHRLATFLRINNRKSYFLHNFQPPSTESDQIICPILFAPIPVSMYK